MGSELWVLLQFLSFYTGVMICFEICSGYFPVLKRVLKHKNLHFAFQQFMKENIQNFSIISNKYIPHLFLLFLKIVWQTSIPSNLDTMNWK